MLHHTWPAYGECGRYKPGIFIVAHLFAFVKGEISPQAKFFRPPAGAVAGAGFCPPWRSNRTAGGTGGAAPPSSTGASGAAASGGGGWFCALAHCHRRRERRTAERAQVAAQGHAEGSSYGSISYGRHYHPGPQGRTRAAVSRRPGRASAGPAAGGRPPWRAGGAQPPPRAGRSSRRACRGGAQAAPGAQPQ